MATVAALRAHLATASISAQSHVSESPLFAVTYGMRLVRVMLLLAVWGVVLAGRGTVSGMTLADVLTYTLIAEAFAEPLDCRTGIEWEFWDGSIARRLLRPAGLFAQLAAEMVGRWGFGLVFFSAPLMACAPLLGVRALPDGLRSAGLFALSLCLAVLVGLAIELIVSGLAAALDLEPYAMNNMRAAASWLLSGAFLPLALFPWGIGAIFAWLPFASMASAPLSIYTGTGDAARLLLMQVGWLAVLWPVARWVWRALGERMVSHGG